MILLEAARLEAAHLDLVVELWPEVAQMQVRGSFDIACCRQIASIGIRGREKYGYLRLGGDIDP